jgi:hypothetical protein
MLICCNKKCGRIYDHEEQLTEDGRCFCGMGVDKLVVCKWCSEDVAECNTYKGFCEECWEDYEDEIKKELA